MLDRVNLCRIKIALKVPFLACILACMANQVFELFGHPIADRSPEAQANRKSAHCPFMDGPCDGGGNRHQTTVYMNKLDPEKELDRDFAAFYEGSGLAQVVPGVCSIKSDRELWIVCPRRLFGVKSTGTQLLQREIDALADMDNLPRGVPIGIWPEVNIKWSRTVDGERETFEYHFDYVAAPVSPLTVRQISELYPTLSATQVANAAFEGDPQVFNGQDGSVTEDKLLFSAPDLSALAIIEVMTASTSGSNTAAGTDIASVFKKAITGKEHRSPGINKRQVWGRMGTQLFSKSAAAERWGGRTYWLLQDQFLEEIERSTYLSVNRIQQAVKDHHKGEAVSEDAINLSIFNTDRRTGKLDYMGIINGPAGLKYHELNHSFLGIILPNAIPPKDELMRALLKTAPVTTFTLPVLEPEAAAE